MGVFNNLVMYKQDVPQSGMQSIVADLASQWSWDEDKTQLTFRLREGVNWHDGKPFTAKDVVCTWDLLTGKSDEKLRINPRKAWYRNLDKVTTNGDFEVTFHLKRPQPAFIALLASGFSPIYPCHVSPRDMRNHPIGTGPFKFVEFKPNESIKVTRNPEYWKKGQPYLDGIEYQIIKNVSTGVLAFVAGKVDMTSPYFLQVPVVTDIKNQAPTAICELVPVNVNRNVMMNREAPPFNNPDLRRAMALSLDRKAFVDTLTLGKGDIGGVMQPPPEGVWGMPPEMLKTLPGYDPDVQKNRAEGRGIMEKLGYRPDKRLEIKVSTRNLAPYRDAAIILIDQLKEIYITGELEPVDTVQWFPKVMRGTVPSVSTSPAMVSMTRTRLCMRTSPAERREIMTATAIRSSTRWSTGNRWNSTRRSAGNWCGRSKGSWQMTRPDRSSGTTVPGPAGNPMSRGTPRWSTASTTAGAWKTSGSTSSRRGSTAKLRLAAKLRVRQGTIASSRYVPSPAPRRCPRI
jgi:peptide/nickel transport system substrate-binding protein